MSDAPDRPAVVHLLWAGGIGGIERLVGDLAREQARRGMDVRLALGQASGPLVQSAGQAGIEVIDLGLASGYDVRPARLRAGVTVLRAADLVHAHAFNVPLSLMLTRSRRPIVLSDHGKVPATGRRSVPERLKEALYGRLVRRRDVHVAANSRHTAQRLHARTGVPGDLVTVVHNGIDPDWLGADPAPAPAGGGLVVTSLGRLVDFKRVDRLLQAAALAEANAGLAVRVVGDGPLRSELQRLADDLGLADRVSFLGARADVTRILGESDVLVHASRDEPFGMAVAEAAALGVLPVVFDDAGGALEVIPPDGRVVHDVPELARTLSELPESPALSPAARRNRAAWTRERFSIGRTADDYEALYRAAAGRAR